MWHRLICRPRSPIAIRAAILRPAAWWALVALCLATAGPARAQDDQRERFLQGLRERRQFFLAENFCRRQLQQSDLDPRTRAELTIEYSRTLAEHAVQLPPVEADALWQQATDAINDYLLRYRDQPRALLVRVQGALVELGHGVLLRRQS